MGKSKITEPEILDEIREEEQPSVKGPLRDGDPEPEYVPAWQVVNRRQDVYADVFPPKIFSLEALIAAGVVNETNLAAYLTDNGYVKNTDYATETVGGVIKASSGASTAIATSGALIGVAKTAAQYESAAGYNFISKGTLENIKTTYIAGGLTAIAAAQITPAPATSGYYNLRLYYDADLDAWGVVISAAT